MNAFEFPEYEWIMLGDAGIVTASGCGVNAELENKEDICEEVDGCN